MLLAKSSIAVLFSILAVQSNGIEDDWHVVSPPGVGASVEMPTIPQFKQQWLQPVRDREEILVRTRSSVINNGNTNLTFVYHDEHRTPVGRIQVKRVLDGAMSGAMALVNGELITQDEIFIGSHKGRDFVYSCEIGDAKLQKVHDLKIRTKLMLVGQRLYSLNYISVMSDYDENVADRFFDSFQLVNSPNDLPPKPRPGRARALAMKKADPSVPVAKPSEPLPAAKEDEVKPVEAGVGGESRNESGDDNSKR